METIPWQQIKYSHCIGQNQIHINLDKSQIKKVSNINKYYLPENSYLKN